MKETEKIHSAKDMQDEAAVGGGSSHQNLERMSGRMRTGLGNGAETRNWVDIYQWENFHLLCSQRQGSQCLPSREKAISSLNSKWKNE